MNARKLRNIAFQAHRYIGLAVAMILIIVGLTGSILVFYPEMDNYRIDRQFGTVIPQGEKISSDRAIEIVKDHYKDRPDWKISWVETLPDRPYKAWLTTPTKESTVALVNPYTSRFMGDYVWDKSIFGTILKLHYQFLVGDVGTIIVGIAAFLMFMLSITGLMLWNGWRNLWLGFKIKWNASAMRLNFDIHKTAGILSVAFLTVLSLTGFGWNFSAQSTPVIHAVTFTPILPEVKSRPIGDRSPINISELTKKADALFPQSSTTYLVLPSDKEGVLTIGKKQLGESLKYGQTQIKFDQFSGEVLQIQDAFKPTRAEKVLNSFAPLHYGSFGGVPTRILYVFVGLSPLVLFITGAKMFKLRLWNRKRKQPVRDRAMDSLNDNID
ncbi:PepSY-associated TM helix domain-containing protein [Chamaesiphon sp.]|uniref:PepSY-associated TM helix domain-containing protein n=1 Tax=Chamaesiphon sp. TaxID=2814140 RepID=UPI0035931AAC